MTDPKDFIAGMDSNAQTYPEVLFRALVAIEVLTIALVGVSLLFNAPLEGIANPLVTPNPAKAPWYFLGLQEMLHYFPPVVAGVLAPGLVVMALIVIPYFNINIEAEGLFLKDRKRRLLIFYLVAAGLSLFLLFLPEQPMYVALVPTLIVAGFMVLAAQSSPQSTSAFRRYLAAKPLSFWIMTWFLFELTVLTAVGTFFRGPGWSWVLPWRS
jgi:quinol-cytochrome oxidoreductase complex cytochrome b subunit